MYGVIIPKEVRKLLAELPPPNKVATHTQWWLSPFSFINATSLSLAHLLGGGPRRHCTSSGTWSKDMRNEMGKNEKKTGKMPCETPARLCFKERCEFNIAHENHVGLFLALPVVAKFDCEKIAAGKARLQHWRRPWGALSENKTVYYHNWSIQIFSKIVL